MTKKLTFETVEDQNSYIIDQHKKEVPASEIASTINVSKRTVERVYSSFKIRKTPKRKVGSRGSKKLNRSAKLKILSLIKKSPHMNTQEISDAIGNVVKRETIRNYLHEKGYVWKKPKKTPNLSDGDKFKRGLFAESHLGYPFETTFFSDECTFTVNESTHGWAKKEKV